MNNTTMGIPPPCFLISLKIESSAMGHWAHVEALGEALKAKSRKAETAGEKKLILIFVTSDSDKFVKYYNADV